MWESSQIQRSLSVWKSVSCIYTNWRIWAWENQNLQILFSDPRSYHMRNGMESRTFVMFQENFSSKFNRTTIGLFTNDVLLYLYGGCPTPSPPPDVFLRSPSLLSYKLQTFWPSRKKSFVNRLNTKWGRELKSTL
jgi:hypothetical protein